MIPAVPCGWFTDDDHPAGTNTTDRRTKREFWWAEAPGNHRIEVHMPRTNRVFDVGSKHAHSISHAHSSSHLRQEVGPLGAPVEQRDREVRAVHRKNETRNAAAGTEIDQRTRHISQCVNEAPGVLDHFVDGSVPQKAEALGSSQRLVQFFIDLVASS